MKCIKIHKVDSVAVAVEPLNKGETVTVDNAEITLLNDIPAGHKFALQDIANGENIIEYAYPIGQGGRIRTINIYSVKFTPHKQRITTILYENRNGRFLVSAI